MSTQFRKVLNKSLAATILVTLLLAVTLPCVAVLFHPMTTKSPRPPWLLVTTLDTLPKDGEPELFHVSVANRDAWERRPNKPVGSIYLRRRPDSETVVALSTRSPWLGCLIEYDEQRSLFRCSCHHEDYDLDGRRIDPSPAPRDLDRMRVSLRGNEIWVKWQPPTLTK